jgi:gliding motility-associated-like protein
MIGMLSTKPSRLLLPVLLCAAFSAQSASGVTIYRIGSPFPAAEKDSLEGLGIDFKEVSWSAAQLQNALELDSLKAGSLQPNFFDQDEDIAATLLGRDGKVWIKLFAHEDRLIGQVLLDEDPTTARTWLAIAPESFALRAYQEKVTFDLGGRFLLREVRFRPLAERPDHFLESFSIGVNVKGFDTYRIPTFAKIIEVKENTEPEVRLVLDPPVTTEAVQLLIFRKTPKEIGIADFELLGGGFVGRASYESDIIELDDIASWGEIRWSGRQDPHARVDIRTRAGVDPHPEIFWESRTEQQDSVKFLQGGGDLRLTEYIRQYARLADFLKPADPRDRVTFDAENWSFWSSPYAFENPGVDVVSPGPRQFIQIRAEFSSTIEDGGKIDYIEFEASVPPAVRRLVGEIYPITTEVGKTTHFTYYINPTIRSGDSSFDGVEISTPSGVVSVDSLRLDAINQDEFSWRIHEDGLGFEVLLPRRLEPTDSGALVEVVFNAPVLREVGTVFDGRVFDTSKPNEVRQRIIPGNAADEIESDLLSVRTSLSSSLVFSPQVSPNPFTPNGDGINDIVTISYKLLRITAAVPVSIEIFDLSGRLVKQVYAGDDPFGEYSHVWDGTDSSNSLVPPGLYLYRIMADVQSERQISNGVVSVAY